MRVDGKELGQKEIKSYVGPTQNVTYLQRLYCGRVHWHNKKKDGVVNWENFLSIVIALGRWWSQIKTKSGGIFSSISIELDKGF